MARTARALVHAMARGAAGLLASPRVAQQAQQHGSAPCLPLHLTCSYASSSAPGPLQGPGGEGQKSAAKERARDGLGGLLDIATARLKQQLDPGPWQVQLPPSPFLPASARRGPDVQRLVLYRGPGLLLWRFLVRAKVFQVMGVATAMVLVGTALGTGTGPSQPQDVAAAVAVLLGCLVTSYCVWFYSSRYVGELSLLLPDNWVQRKHYTGLFTHGWRVARFSVLDFWGNRQDVDVPIQAIQPPFQGRTVAEVRTLASRPLLPISVTGDRQYYISVRHGGMAQKDILQKICYGSWLSELDAAEDKRSPPELDGVPTAAPVKP